jgi:hypothetical protein
MIAIYRAIQSAVERYALAMGIDAVLLVSPDDLTGETLNEVMNRIGLRSVIYHADGLDVTDPILSILNG